MGTQATTSDERKARTLRQRLARRGKAKSDWLGRIIYVVWSFHRTFSLPLPAAFGRALRAERDARTAIWGFLKRVLYYDPLFRAACDSVGARLHLIGPPPLVVGEGSISLGSDVQIMAPTTFAFSRMSGRRSRLTVGDRTIVSCRVSIFVAEEVTIGSDCIIGPGVNIYDNPAHPTDPEQRLSRSHLRQDDIRPVVIEDNCWISSDAKILPGVRIGEGTVIGAASVVTHSVPSYSLAAGNPARVIKSLRRHDAGEWIDMDPLSNTCRCADPRNSGSGGKAL